MVTSQTNILLVSIPIQPTIFRLNVKLNAKIMINVLLSLIIIRVVILQVEIAFFIVLNACFHQIIKLMVTLDIQLAIICKISS